MLQKSQTPNCSGHPYDMLSSLCVPTKTSSARTSTNIGIFFLSFFNGFCVLTLVNTCRSNETTAAAINISPMTAAGHELCVGGSWQDCILDSSVGEQVMADLESWLLQVAAQ